MSRFKGSSEAFLRIAANQNVAESKGEDEIEERLDNLTDVPETMREEVKEGRFGS